MKRPYVIGIDYGTDSARAVITDALNGDEIASAVEYFPRWAAGKYCNSSKDCYRQHPLDYLETLEIIIRAVLSSAGKEIAANVVGISFDTTGSTPVLVNKEGIPLSLLPDFAENPNAMFILWKDHTAVKEASEINKSAFLENLINLLATPYPVSPVYTIVPLSLSNLIE
jgi:L-ribulokinase